MKSYINKLQRNIRDYENMIDLEECKAETHKKNAQFARRMKSRHQETLRKAKRWKNAE